MDDVIAGGEKGREGGKKVEGVDVVVGVVTGGGAVEKRWTVVDKLLTRLLESIWTPCSPERSQGVSALHPHYKGAVAVT